MPISVTTDWKGIDELWARLDAEVAQKEVREALERVAIRLVGIVKRDKLSGQVLNNVTGTLRRSINERVGEEDGSITAWFGSFAGYFNPKGGEAASGYGAIHEYGGTFQIPEHTRRIGYDRDSSRVRLLGRLKAIRGEVETYGESTVRAHSATYPERSFLRSTLAENRDEVNEGLMRGIKRAMRIGAL